MCFRPAGAAKAMQCPECKAFNKPGNTVCQKCGTDFTAILEELAAAEPSANAPGNAPMVPGNAPMAPKPPGNAPRPAAPQAPGAPTSLPKPPAPK